MKAKSTALAATMLLIAGCTDIPASRVDALRGLAPATSARVAAGYREVSACLIDQERQRSYQVVPVIRDLDHSATLTGYSVGTGRHPFRQMFFEYDVTEVGTGASRISVKRADFIPWNEPADARLQQDMATCGIAMRS